MMYTVKVSYWVRKEAEIQVANVNDTSEAEDQALDMMDDIPERDWRESELEYLSAETVDKD